MDNISTNSINSTNSTNNWTTLYSRCTYISDCHMDLVCSHVGINMCAYLKFNMPLELHNAAGVTLIKQTRQKKVFQFDDDDYELLLSYQRNWTPKIGIVPVTCMQVRARWINPRTNIRNFNIWLTWYSPIEKTLNCPGRHCTIMQYSVEDSDTDECHSDPDADYDV